MLDVFHSDAFTTLELTTAVEKVPYLPTGIGRLDVFEEDPIRTKELAVEVRQGQLVLIPASDRGAPLTERTTELRNMLYFKVPRLATGDTLMADELQSIRAFGQESELMQVQAEVARRLSGPTGLLKNIEYTWENQRLGAISGSLIDADGSTVIYNWFTSFGITQPTEIAFNLTGWQGTSPSTSDGALRQLCNQTARAIKRAAKGAFIEGVSEICCMCGDQFWDQLVTHPDVVKTYLNWMAAAELRQGNAWDAMLFGGIRWFNYRGSDDNDATIGVATTKCKFFLRKAPGVFKVARAPAEFGPWINTPGKKYYVIPIIDRDRQAWWRMEVYSYPLFICTRPETLFSGRCGT
jgi:hypothetical protein